MCAKKLNALPYRRLRLMANGIWDEVRKEFYPFLSSVSSATITGKKGIMYYVKFVSISAQNTGDHAVAFSSAKITQRGATRYLLQLLVPVSVAATNIPSSGTISQDAHILCDSGKSIELESTATTAYWSVVYAEIPDDPAGGPVMIE